MSSVIDRRVPRCAETREDSWLWADGVSVFCALNGLSDWCAGRTEFRGVHVTLVFQNLSAFLVFRKKRGWAASVSCALDLSHADLVYVLIVSSQDHLRIWPCHLLFFFKRGSKLPLRRVGVIVRKAFCYSVWESKFYVTIRGGSRKDEFDEKDTIRPDGLLKGRRSHRKSHQGGIETAWGARNRGRLVMRTCHFVEEDYVLDVDASLLDYGKVNSRGIFFPEVQV